MHPTVPKCYDTCKPSSLVFMIVGNILVALTDSLLRTESGHSVRNQMLLLS